MKKHLFWLILLITICLTLNSCTQAKKKEQNRSYQNSKFYKKKNLDSLLQVIIRTKPAKMEIASEYLTDSAFVEIYEHSPGYLTDVKRFVKENPFASDKLAICVYAMQDLNCSDYVDLCEAYLELYNWHKVSEKMLEFAIAPNFLQKRILADNRSDPRVIKLLDDIKKENISNEFRELIDDILSG